MSDKCRSCGAAIIWAKTAAGRSVPIDAEPAADGNIYLGPGGDCEVLSKADVEATHAKEDLSGRHTRLYKSHFATCPNAKQHRKPK